MCSGWGGGGGREARQPNCNTQSLFCNGTADTQTHTHKPKHHTAPILSHHRLSLNSLSPVFAALPFKDAPSREHAARSEGDKWKTEVSKGAEPAPGVEKENPFVTSQRAGFLPKLLLLSL